ncbi:MAG: MBL fold metallo-hydrolase [Archangiaceae bacterium]|nr:MBL fold metallo-hydrolase [Archangiaceae bacterium]
MSERIAGIELPELGPPATPRDAAAVVLYRKVGRSIEVFWIKREAKLAFAGGYYAFPGGKVDKADAGVPVEGATGVDAALRVAAARELLEETGVLVAQGTISAADTESMRRALLDRESKASFGELLAKHGLTLRAADWPEAGRWVTPPHLPVRFDARFYLVEAPEGAKAEVWPGELTEGAWVTPNAALNRWNDGTALLHPPNVHALQTMAVFRTAEKALGVLRAPPMVTDFIARRIEFQMGIRVFPLLTPTLPPAHHTNCYVLGNSDLLIVDPGSPDDAETDRLVSFVRELMADGYKPRAVLLTHHHGDHVGGAARVMSELKGPLWCHAQTADRVPLTTEKRVADGDYLKLGGMELKFLHTPGHARGHLCIFHLHSKAAIVGDMVAGVGTIVIDPPEGDMAEYLRQLQRLKELGVRTLYPAHGPPIPDGPAKLDEYLQHRAWREGKVVAALKPSPQSLEALVPQAYDDVQAFILPLAERNTVAILEKLVAEGRAQRDGELFSLSPSGRGQG